VESFAGFGGYDDLGLETTFLTNKIINIQLGFFEYYRSICVPEFLNIEKKILRKSKEGNEDLNVH
jgi:hypothetical protein